MRRTLLTTVKLAVASCIITAARGQCPTDFTQWFNDYPEQIGANGNLVLTAVTRFDPDGSGPQAPIYIGAFYIRWFTSIAQNTVEQSRIDRWDEAAGQWVPLSGVFDGIVNAMTTFDEDQSGPNPARLYIGGRFSDFGLNGGATVSSSNIMRYDGTAFSAVRNGLNGEVHTMLVFDDDAAGPTASKLYVGGNFSGSNSSSAQGSVSAGRLIRLTGGLLWENPSAGFDDRVFALCSYDEDGTGPGLPKLAAGGAFSSNNGDGSQRLVAIYNGSSWAPLSQGLDTMINAGGSGRRVFSLAEFDEDGTGPQNPSLFVGGSIYQTTQGLASPLVIRWRRNYLTGVSGWIAVAAAPNLSYQSTADSCANFCSNTPVEGNRPRVLCMLPFDTDGTGATPSELYIGGAFTGSDVSCLMKWNATDGCQWVYGESGRSFQYAPAVSNSSSYAAYPNQCMTMIAVPGNASVSPTLLAGGGMCEMYSIGLGIFHWISRVPTFHLAAWSAGGVGPSVTNPPDNAWTTLPGSTSAGFNINLSGTAPFTYRWRKDGVDLVNGTSQGFGGIIGSTGSAVILGGTANPVNVTSQGWYDCRIGNACGTGYTTAAWLVVQPDATPFFPIRFDAPAAPVITAIGNADMRYIFTGAPYPRFFTYVDGTPFAIAPTGNNAWRGRLAAGSATGNRSVTIPTSRYGVGEVYTMFNTDGSSSTNVRLQFNASGGLVYTTTLAGGNSIRSYTKFYGPQSIVSPDTGNVFDNGINQMDKQRILLPNSFRLQTLTSITITDLGTDSTGRAILAGLTLRQRPPACGPADLGGVGGQRGADGVLDNNDFIVFIDLYFNGDLTADVGTTGGVPGADGVLDNNDFIVYINQFFNGC